jgi:hypothetical protein
MLVAFENPLSRLQKNFRKNVPRWRDLSKRQKWIIGGVAAGTVAAVAITIAAWPKAILRRRAIEVGPGCTTYTVVDEQQLRDDMRRIARAYSIAGPLDPLTISAKIVRGYAPFCPTYPADTQNPVQVQLYAEVFNTLLGQMQSEGIIDPNDFATWHAMMTTWAAGQGVDPSTL